MDAPKTENDAELTSTMGNVLSSSKDEKNDSTPTSSTDANTNSEDVAQVGEDPISSTSKEIEDKPVECPVTPKSDDINKMLALENDAELLGIKNTSSEKITEDVEDLVHDLESLLGESTDAFNISNIRSEHTKAKEAEIAKIEETNEIKASEENVPEKEESCDDKKEDNSAQTSEVEEKAEQSAEIIEESKVQENSTKEVEESIKIPSETVENQSETVEKPLETVENQLETIEKPVEIVEKPLETAEESKETVEELAETIESTETIEKLTETVESTETIEKLPEAVENLSETVENPPETIEESTPNETEDAEVPKSSSNLPDEPDSCPIKETVEQTENNETEIVSTLGQIEEKSACDSNSLEEAAVDNTKDQNLINEDRECEQTEAIPMECDNSDELVEETSSEVVEKEETPKQINETTPMEVDGDNSVPIEENIEAIKEDTQDLEMKSPENVDQKQDSEDIEMENQEIVDKTEETETQIVDESKDEVDSEKIETKTEENEDVVVAPIVEESTAEPTEETKAEEVIAENEEAIAESKAEETEPVSAQTVNKSSEVVEISSDDDDKTPIESKKEEEGEVTESAIATTQSKEANEVESTVETVESTKENEDEVESKKEEEGEVTESTIATTQSKEGNEVESTVDPAQSIKQNEDEVVESTVESVESKTENEVVESTNKKENEAESTVEKTESIEPVQVIEETTTVEETKTAEPVVENTEIKPVEEKSVELVTAVDESENTPEASVSIEENVTESLDTTDKIVESTVIEADSNEAVSVESPDVVENITNNEAASVESLDTAEESKEDCVILNEVAPATAEVVKLDTVEPPKSVFDTPNSSEESSPAIMETINDSNESRDSTINQDIEEISLESEKAEVEEISSASETETVVYNQTQIIEKITETTEEIENKVVVVTEKVVEAEITSASEESTVTKVDDLPIVVENTEQATTTTTVNHQPEVEEESDRCEVESSVNDEIQTAVASLVEEKSVQELEEETLRQAVESISESSSSTFLELSQTNEEPTQSSISEVSVPDTSNSVAAAEPTDESDSSDETQILTMAADQAKMNLVQNKSQLEKPLSITVEETKEAKCYSPKLIIKPVKAPEEEITTTTNTEIENREPIKMTITKQADKMHSILKIYSPTEQEQEVVPSVVEQTVPKLIIKQQPSPKMATRSSKQYNSPTSSTPTRSASPRSSSNRADSVSPLKITIKNTAKSETEKHSPKLIIKPVIKTDEEERSPKINIKPIKSPDEVEQVHSPKIRIKPIPKPEELAEPHTPRLNIKPIRKQDSENKTPEDTGGKSSPKITIKPIVKPAEEDIKSPEDEEVKERIVLKINKGNLTTPSKESKKRDHSADEKSEKLGKIKLKFSKEGGHPHIVQPSNEDVTTNKRPLEEPAVPEKTKKFKAEETAVAVDGAAIPATPTNNPGHEEQPDKAKAENPEPLNNLPTPTPEVAQTAAVPPVPVTPMPRKRGRPRKVPIEVKDDPSKNEAKVEDAAAAPVASDTGRPKRSCRGQNARVALGIKPRKPRGGGRGRGGMRGMGTRAIPMKPAKELKLSKARLKLLEKCAREAFTGGKPLPAQTEQSSSETVDSTTGERISPLITTTSAGTDTPPSEGENLLIQHSIEESITTESLIGDVDIVTASSSSTLPEIAMFEEETRMSAEASSRAQTPAKQVVISTPMDIEESQSSMHSTATVESGKTPISKNRGTRLEIQHDPDTNIISADQLAEYYWNGNGPFMLQEQVAQFLGIKSFKRKYPNVQRRFVDMQERDFIRESSLASEAMCDLGLTAVCAADILDIMYSDFQDKYEEYCKHQRDRQTKDLINKQKAMSLAASQEKNKIDITEQAVQSAASWNSNFNKMRKEQRKASMDLQTLTVHYPKGRIKQINKPKIGHYPVSLVPGQFTDYYQEFTPTEINNLPLNTMCYDPIDVNPSDESDTSGSDGSDSDSSSESDSDSSGSCSEDEDDCKLCKQNTAKKVASMAK